MQLLTRRTIDTIKQGLRGHLLLTVEVLAVLVKVAVGVMVPIMVLGLVLASMLVVAVRS